MIMVSTPPRELPMNIARTDAKRNQDADDVGKLDRAVVVGVIGVVIGVAASAQVDCDHVALRGPRGKRRSEFVKVGGGSGEAGQAHHRQAGRGAQAVFANMHAQPVMRGYEVTLTLMGRAVSRVRHQMRGWPVHACPNRLLHLAPAERSQKGH